MVQGNAPGSIEAMVADVNELIGQELRIEQFNHEVTYDAIRHYAFGIGDDNPLWCDEDYASRSRFGQMVGPPTFYLSVFPPTLSPGLPGFSTFQAGGDYRWNRLPLRGERIIAKSTLTDLVERSGRTADLMFIQYGETRYETNDGEVLAIFGSRSFRIPPKDEDTEIYAPVEQRTYAIEELAGIAQGVFAEEVRGQRPRYWDDVNPGEVLTPVVKGPLDQTSMICYYAGAMPGIAYRPVDLAWKQRLAARTKPDLVPNNFNISKDLYDTSHVGLGHHDEKAAHSVGMPARYDNGHMRIGWVSHLVTNWMGDDGFLKRLYSEIRRPNLYGNTTWMRGTVASRRVDDDGDYVVDIDIVGTDQDGIVNTRAKATVDLPSRSRISVADAKSRNREKR